MEYPTLYRTTQIDGLSVFYREAGPKDAPTLLLLHGLPSSSRMFGPLFARLSDRYHLVAPTARLGRRPRFVGPGRRRPMGTPDTSDRGFPAANE
jgi:pimeloyl-ACP methyl ester carboxylesterase